MLSNKRANEQVKRQSIELYELECKFKQLKAKYEKKKEALTISIKNFMFINTEGITDEFEFEVQAKDDTSRGVLTVKKITPTVIVWDADKLEKQLGKERSQSIIEKRYTIEDYDGLVEYLKECGVSPKKFKSFLSVERTVNQQALKQADDLGEITDKDISDCYKTQIKSSYLKISVLEDNN